MLTNRAPGSRNKVAQVVTKGRESLDMIYLIYDEPKLAEIVDEVIDELAEERTLTSALADSIIGTTFVPQSNGGVRSRSATPKRVHRELAEFDNFELEPCPHDKTKMRIKVDVTSTGNQADSNLWRECKDELDAVVV